MNKDVNQTLEDLHKQINEIQTRLMKIELSYLTHFHDGVLKTSSPLDKIVRGSSGSARSA